MFSKRLNTIAKLIDNEYPLADIGSDHGQLIEILINNGFNNDILGVENKEGPFSNLSKNISKLNNPNIKVSFSNGLCDVSDYYKTIVIAGMGFETIKNIINDSIKKLDSIETFIIDCHTNFEQVRPFFCNLGYYIENEISLNEKNIYYDIIKFKKGHKEYSNLELKYGPINLVNKPDAFVQNIKQQIFSIEELLKKQTSKEKLSQLLFKLNELKGLIDHEN